MTEEFEMIKSLLGMGVSGGMISRETTMSSKSFEKDRYTKAQRELIRNLYSDVVLYGTICKYRKGVECGIRNCSECGWNPEVEKKRIKAWRQEWSENLRKKKS